MRWLLIMVTLSALVAACGGDGELSVSEYRNEVGKAVDRAKVDEVYELFENASKQPALTFNEDWKRDTLDGLDTWHEPLKAIDDLNPPAEAEAAHAAALLAYECLSDIADQVEPMIESESSSYGQLEPLINSCGSLISDMTAEFRELPDS